MAPSRRCGCLGFSCEAPKGDSCARVCYGLGQRDSSATQKQGNLNDFVEKAYVDEERVRNHAKRHNRHLRARNSANKRPGAKHKSKKRGGRESDGDEGDHDASQTKRETPPAPTLSISSGSSIDNDLPDPHAKKHKDHKSVHRRGSVSGTVVDVGRASTNFVTSLFKKNSKDMEVPREFKMAAKLLPLPEAAAADKSHELRHVFHVAIKDLRSKHLLTSCDEHGCTLLWLATRKHDLNALEMLFQTASHGDHRLTPKEIQDWATMADYGHGLTPAKLALRLDDAEASDLIEKQIAQAWRSLELEDQNSDVEEGDVPAIEDNVKKQLKDSLGQVSNTVTCAVGGPCHNDDDD